MRHFFHNMKTEQLYNLFKNSKGVSTDSRKVGHGQIFFALWGDNYNGNKFAAEALEKGAAWAVIDDSLFETEKTILVDDCLFELQALAAHHRKEMKFRSWQSQEPMERLQQRNCWQQSYLKSLRFIILKEI